MVAVADGEHDTEGRQAAARGADTAGQLSGHDGGGLQQQQQQQQQHPAPAPPLALALPGVG